MRKISCNVLLITRTIALYMYYFNGLILFSGNFLWHLLLYNHDTINKL